MYHKMVIKWDMYDIMKLWDKTFGNPVQRSSSGGSWLSFESSNASKYQCLSLLKLFPHMLFTSVAQIKGSQY